MDDAREPQSEHSPPYLHLPWPAVAAILVAVLGLLLAAGIYANRNLRPQVGIVPTPAVASAATPGSAIPPTATPLPITTAEAISAVLISQASPTAATPPAVPTEIVAQAATAMPTALPTVEPAVADDVGKSYETYWRVRSQALLTLDATHLSEVMDGEYLTQFESQLRSLQEQGRAIKTQVTLDYQVVQAANGTAIIHDHIEDDSFYVRAGTENPLTEPANDVLRLELTLRKSQGSWKVIDSVSAD
jgi:hypothetical protein